MHQGRDCATQPEGSADWLTKRGDRMHSFMCLHSFTRSASPHQVAGLSVSHTHTHTHTHRHTHTHTHTHLLSSLLLWVLLGRTRISGDNRAEGAPRRGAPRGQG